MAAALHAKILAEGYTPACLLRAAWTGALVVEDLHLRPKFVTPQQFVAPRPQKGPHSFAKVINWTEEEPVPSPRAPRSVHGYEYMRHGGMYVSCVLSKAREMVRCYRDHEYERKMSDPRFVNEAPAWPPAPEFVLNPPRWGGEALSNPSEPPCEDKDKLYASHGPTPQPQVATPCGRTTQGYSDAATTPPATATGFFVGRDGSRWPLPPSECVSPILSRLPGLPPPPQDHHERHSYDGVCDGLDRCRLSPQSVHSGSSGSSTTLIPTPPNLSVKASLHVGIIGEGRSRRGYSVVVQKDRERLSSQTPNALRMNLGWDASWRDTTKRGSPETDPSKGFFYGRDGSLWPMPPNQEDLLAGVGRVYRGRNPVPKW